nr:MAG TPA: hypothetical protein [Caudoviricetes sp.]
MQARHISARQTSGHHHASKCSATRAGGGKCSRLRRVQRLRLV